MNISKTNEPERSIRIVSKLRCFEIRVMMGRILVYLSRDYEWRTKAESFGSAGTVLVFEVRFELLLRELSTDPTLAVDLPAFQQGEFAPAVALLALQDFLICVF